EKTRKIAHIPRILYHRKRVDDSSLEAGYSTSAEAALASAIERRRIDGHVETGLAPGLFRVRRTFSNRGKVSIIIPTRDRLDLLTRCVDSIGSKTDYDNYEIVIVDNGSKEQPTTDYLSRTPHRVVGYDGPFNYSLLNNLAARHCDGDYLLLLNNDTEVIASEWLSAMVEHAARDEVGAVGAKLLYPDNRIQHAGVVLGVRGLAGHAHRFVDGLGGEGYFNFPNAIMNYSAVTAACLMIRRELYHSVGGLNEEDLAVSFNDVDLCLRLRRLGYLIVYTPYALLYHHESATRSLVVEHREPSYLASRWKRELISDRHYNPSLTLSRANFSIDTTKLESFYRENSYESSNAIIAHLAEGESAGQEFFAGQDHLCAIAVRLGLSNRQSSGVIRFHLRESYLSDMDLAAAELGAAQSHNDQWHTFTFGPVRRSGGGRFYFFIELIGASPGVRLNVWGSSATSLAVGNCFKNHRAAQGTLSFRAYCLKQVRGFDSASF
ncbi:MAG TPA: glycosyltransferase family 2 protein, partial [Blastocatellia bacterium]|nr:glycosyltransferase family 2 protein [Blastocatellia bacterium]